MVKSSATNSYFHSVVKLFRRFSFVRVLFLAISYAVTFLGTGIAFIVAASLFLVVLPIAAILGFVIFFASLVRRKRVCNEMAELLRGKKICVFFPTREPKFSDSRFFAGMCRSFTQSGSAVLIVTPFFLSPAGIGGKGMFLTVRKEETDIYTVRRYAFFALRKRVLKNSENCVYFY